MNRSKGSRKPSGDLEVIARHWQYVPEQMKANFVAMISYFKPEANGACFPTPPGTDWGDVEIVLLSPEEARFTVGTVSHCYTYRALGLVSRRPANKPSAEWRMLRTYADNPEPDAYYRLPFRGSLKVETSKFRRWLQGFFGLPGDPLQPFETKKWLPRFKIRADYL